MSPSPSLESMPNEVKMILLTECFDIQTLSSLVHASPSFHALYAASRGHAFTTVTLRTLDRRNVRVLQPMHWALIYLKGPNINFGLVKEAIELCIRQMARKTSPSLNFEHCQALLNIRATKRWLYDEDNIEDARKIHDAAEEDTFIALDMRDPEVHRRIVPIKGWPKPKPKPKKNMRSLKEQRRCVVCSWKELLNEALEVPIKP